MTSVLDPIFNIFRFHKKKILAFMGFFIFFLYWIFPFNDLGDLVAAKVSELTGRQIFVNFDTLDLSLIPQPGLELTNVVVETPFTPSLTAKSLEVAPSIAGLLSFKPGLSLHAEGLLGGDVDLSTRGGDKTAAGKLKQKISVGLSDLNMLEISKLAQLPLNVNGELSGDLTSQVDIDFTEQPSGTVNMKVAKAIIPEANLATQMGPFMLPKMTLNDIVLEGQADKGVLSLSKLIIGKPGGDLYANVTGKVDLKFEKLGQNVQPRFGAYDLTVHLAVGEALKQKLGVYLGILQAYQSAANSYAFRISAPNMYVPPNLVKAQ